MMSSTFSCAYLPCVYILWWSICSHLLYIFIGLFVFLLPVVSVLYSKNKSFFVFMCCVYFLLVWLALPFWEVGSIWRVDGLTLCEEQFVEFSFFLLWLVLFLKCLGNYKKQLQIIPKWRRFSSMFSNWNVIDWLLFLVLWSISN